MIAPKSFALLLTNDRSSRRTTVPTIDMPFIQFRCASSHDSGGQGGRGVGGGRATGGVGGGDLVVVAGRSLYARQPQGAGGATRDRRART